MRTFSWALLPFALAAMACGGGGSEPASSNAEEAEPAASVAAPADEAPQLEGAELAAALADANVFLLDVRNPDELEEIGTVEGYVNIPIDELADRLDELPRDKPILTA